MGSEIRELSPREVDARCKGTSEFAFIDVREIANFGKGHPFFAANVPLSELEVTLPRTSPRRTTPLIITDKSGELANMAAIRLRALGYVDISVLSGGAVAWEQAGFALFPEIEVPSKGFGAFARTFGKPNFISPTDLQRALASEDDWIVLDSRPRTEYHHGNIPGSIDAPGPDLLHCFADLVPSPETKVVVNCMSATRGILGGLSLQAAGVPNDVFVLNHGTRGWLLDGLDLERGASRVAAPPSENAQRVALEGTKRIRDKAGIACVDAATVASWFRRSDRTTYLIDVRGAAEFAANHLPGSVHVPEGQIVMSPEHIFTTRNARIVLVDDDTVRASVAGTMANSNGLGRCLRRPRPARCRGV